MLSKLNKNFIITNKLPKEMLNQVAKVYYSEFQQKFDGLLMLAHSQEQALRILNKSIDPSMGIYALNNEGQILGVVGLGIKGHGFVKYKWQLLLEEFGIFGAILRKIIKFFEAPILKKHQLRIEGIVVTKQAQGQGIGTALLNAVFEQAQKEQYTSIQLEVINTNPDARRLYHRLGFEDSKVVFFGPLTLRAGFSSIWRMKKKISQPQSQIKPCSHPL